MIVDGEVDRLSIGVGEVAPPPARDLRREVLITLALLGGVSFFLGVTVAVLYWWIW